MAREITVIIMEITKIKNKFTGLILCLALSAASLTGCGGEKASEIKAMTERVVQ